MVSGLFIAWKTGAHCPLDAFMPPEPAGHVIAKTKLFFCAVVTHTPSLWNGQAAIQLPAHSYKYQIKSSAGCLVCCGKGLTTTSFLVSVGVDLKAFGFSAETFLPYVCLE